MNKKSLICSIIGIVVVLIIGVVAHAYISVTSGFNIGKDVYIYVDKTKKYEQVLNQVRDSAKVENLTAFDMLASALKYKENVKPGRYKVSADMTVLELVRELRAGMQAPQELTFNNLRLKSELIERISDQMIFSKEELSTLLNDKQLVAKYGFDTLNIVAMFIPNTYEVYWTTKADKLVERMNKEFLKYWNADRLKKAANLGLTPIQVSTLASIVEEECMFVDEYPTVAGLYYNRLKRGQLLQADPTVKYAVGDFTLRRILNKHLAVDSPFNTYKYAGLPPAPIRIPSIKGLEAVLNREVHNYYYMCAKEDFSGHHNFATTLSEHSRNAAKYQRELNKRKIYQ